MKTPNNDRLFQLPFSFTELEWFMAQAVNAAEAAFKLDEVPVGAVLISEGKILASAYNLKERDHNPMGHAEIEVLKEAAKIKKSWRLEETYLVCTLEPCLMCLAAMTQARIGGLIFGAYDAKGGALSLNYNFYKDGRLNHRFPVMGGVRHFECSKILSDYFRLKRSLK